jgi:hypothetical protein
MEAVTPMALMVMAAAGGAAAGAGVVAAMAIHTAGAIDDLKQLLANCKRRSEESAFSFNSITTPRRRCGASASAFSVRD